MANVYTPRPLRGAAKRRRKLTDLQARFILDALTVDWELRREAGFQRHTYRLYQRLGERFGVGRDAIKDIWRRRNFKWLEHANIYDISIEHRNRVTGKK